MKCPKCGNSITGRKRRCEHCGADVSAFCQLRRMSNRMYNQGLEKASVRDLTGAAEVLRKSLEMDKGNVSARNLLGLVYYEMGETTEALCQWVLSQNISSNDNDADRLIDLVRSDSTCFSDQNSAIRKFNVALELATNGNEDMAAIQLKKVISLNDHYVKAYLLLALISIKSRQYERAKKLLKTVLKIDVGNTTARRYINEIKVETDNKNSSAPVEDRGFEDDAYSVSSARTRFNADDKPNILSGILFFAGLVIGIILVYVLAVPNIKKDYETRYAELERRVGTEVSAEIAENSSLKSKISILESKNKDLESELLLKTNEHHADYEPFFELCGEYLNNISGLSERAEKKKLTEEDVLLIESLYEKITAFEMTEDYSERASSIYSEMAEVVSELKKKVSEKQEKGD